MGSGTLEVGGSKLWELVVGEVLLCLQRREGETCGEEVCMCVCGTHGGRTEVIH